MPPELRERFLSLRQRVVEVQTGKELGEAAVQGVADGIVSFYDALQGAAVLAKLNGA